MTPVLTNVLKNLDVQALKELAEQPGPCLTIQVPAYHPGAGSGTRHAYLRQLAQEAAGRLRELKRADETGRVDLALQDLMQMLPLDQGGPGMFLFCAPGFAEAYAAPSASVGDGARSQVTVASRFHILPILVEALAPQDFFILGISRKHIRLIRYAHGVCEELPLPPAVPESLDAAGAFDKPDHSQEGRSSAGPSVGSMRGVRFGTSSDHDSEAEYVRHFFEQVDKGLKEALHGTPLFLAGVHEELALFRKAAKYPHLFEAECHGNPEHASLDQIARHARAGALREYQSVCARVAKGLPEIVNRISSDPKKVFRAAQAGRIHRIFVAEDARMPGTKLAGIYPGEDLINAAVVEALRNGAEVYALPGGDIPGTGPIACVLRY